ncbi:MAG: NAD+ synthase [Anaerolineae bacterium]|uniref:NAD+ synthase n=1 Tax=Candidatus Flexifilum breve TaxID=3140694 RepID=UPI001AC8831A|nr:NAD+ synthase [Chloroflexota bacterium]MBK9746680.1 NAD+ synthase [Chloroflexota bacterium]MBN8635911.1 NAD+ synthase [Anaerolineae bacterium]
MSSIVERLAINTEIARKMLTGFIKDEIAKSGMKRAVLGLSGGIDSALSAYLSAEALGPENVLAVRMPYRTSSADSLSDADLVIQALGIQSLTVPITDMAEPLFAQFPDMSNGRKGNIMARLRMTVLYDQSVAFGGLVMGTSNKTELLLGYSTIYGDSGVALHPIGDLYKTQIRQLGAALNLPESVRTKAPSADLWVGQTDEGELGFTYADVDQVLYLIVDERYTLDEVVAEGFARPFVEGVWRRVKINHYKRTMPNIAKLSRRTIGHDFLYLRDYT